MSDQITQEDYPLVCPKHHKKLIISKQDSQHVFCDDCAIEGPGTGVYTSQYLQGYYAGFNRAIKILEELK